MTDKQLEKCAPCTGLWDTKEQGCFCRYGGNPEECEGPRKPYLAGLKTTIKQEIEHLKNEEQRIEFINEVRRFLHELSPFKHEPVDFVEWVPIEKVFANDYNPNSVAPPEMELLKHSIESDGFTQPIVAWQDNSHYEVVDGFHRNRVGKECPEVRDRILGYLPLAVVNGDRIDRGDRIAATIRHNRARGKHRIEGMSDIVIELKRRNWSDQKIGRELGMEPDEVLRLTQITGLAEMFADRDFSEAWEAQINENDDLEIVKEDIIEQDLSSL